ncbi:flagellar biosynthetic protein FliO, partial [Dermatophilus congolensis]
MSGTSGLELATRTILSLGAVLALLVLFMRWLEKTSNTRRARSTTTIATEVLNRTPLTKNASMHIVRVGGQVLVLGVTDTRVSVLTDLGPNDLTSDDDNDNASPQHATIHPLIGRRHHEAATRIIAAVTARTGRHRDPATTAARLDPRNTTPHTGSQEA